MEKASALAALTRWPTKASEMYVNLMLRIVGAETQRAWLQKMDRRPDSVSDIYYAQTHQVIAGVGLMACIRALKEADPVKAEAFVKDYWLMWDSGDSFGERLWEYTEEAGLNPSLIKLPEAADAVDPADRIVAR